MRGGKGTCKHDKMSIGGIAGYLSNNVFIHWVGVLMAFCVHVELTSVFTYVSLAAGLGSSSRCQHSFVQSSRFPGHSAGDPIEIPREVYSQQFPLGDRSVIQRGFAQAARRGKLPAAGGFRESCWKDATQVHFQIAVILPH